MRGFWLSVAVAVAAGSCSGSRSGGSGSDAGTGRCTAGQTSQCMCDSGCTGTKICDSRSDSPVACDCMDAGNGCDANGDASRPNTDAGSSMGSSRDFDSGQRDAAATPSDAAALADAITSTIADASENPPDNDAASEMPDSGTPTRNELPGALCTSCVNGEKVCDGLCVSVSDPTYGCSTSCVPCVAPHTLTTCSTQGTCAVQSCEAGWADCDGIFANGCETDLTSPDTCGACIASACSGATPLCGPTGCTGACTPPLTQCIDRCVNLSVSPANCGACSATCNSFETCGGGVCGARVCAPNQTPCNGLCPDLNNATYACGSCGHACTQGEACINATCVPAPCQLGWSRCNNVCVTPQTDSANCGTCGHGCPTNQLCAGGQCVDKSSVLLATGLSNPYDLAFDDSQVYWGDIGAGSVNTMSKGGGTIVRLAQDQAKPIRLLVDATHVYWSNNLGGAIMRTLKNASSAAEIVTPATSPASFALDTQYVYFPVDDHVERVLKTGGASAVFAALVAPPNGAINIVEMASDPSALYLASADSSSNETLWKVELATGALTQLSTRINDCCTGNPLIVTGTDVYYIAGQNIGLIEWVDKFGGMNVRSNSAPTSIDAAHPMYGQKPNAFAAAACGVFWSTTNDIYFDPPNGKLAALVAKGPVNRIAVDGAYLYWTDPTGTIARVPIP